MENQHIELLRHQQQLHQSINKFRKLSLRSDFDDLETIVHSLIKWGAHGVMIIGSSAYPEMVLNEIVPWTAKAFMAYLRLIEPKIAVRKFLDAGRLDKQYDRTSHHSISMNPKVHLFDCVNLMMEKTFTSKSKSEIYEAYSIWIELGISDDPWANQAARDVCLKYPLFNPMEALLLQNDNRQLNQYLINIKNSDLPEIIFDAPGFKPIGNLNTLCWLNCARNAAVNPGQTQLERTLSAYPSKTIFKTVLEQSTQWYSQGVLNDLFGIAMDRYCDRLSEQEIIDASHEFISNISDTLKQSWTGDTLAEKTSLNSLISPSARAWLFKKISPDALNQKIPTHMHGAWLNLCVAGGEWKHFCSLIKKTNWTQSALSQSPLAFVLGIINNHQLKISHTKRINLVLPALRKTARLSGKPLEFCQKIVSLFPNNFGYNGFITSELEPKIYAMAAQVDRIFLSKITQKMHLIPQQKKTRL